MKSAIKKACVLTFLLVADVATDSLLARSDGDGSHSGRFYDGSCSHKGCSHTDIDRDSENRDNHNDDAGEHRVDHNGHGKHNYVYHNGAWGYLDADGRWIPVSATGSVFNNYARNEEDFRYRE